MAEQNFTTNFDNLGGIYVLKCPITKKIKYVGQTKNFKKRKNHHFHSNQFSIPMEKWVLTLKEQDLNPVFEIIFICDDQKIKDKVESTLIKKLNKEILNVRSGGLKSGFYLPKHKYF